MARKPTARFIIPLFLFAFMLHEGGRYDFAFSQITDAKWVEDFAYWREWPRQRENAEKIKSSRSVTLTALAPGVDDDTKVPIFIYQHDPGGEHGLVDVITGRVTKGTVSARWKVKILDHQGRYDLACYQPMLFFTLYESGIDGGRMEKSGLLPVYDWFELNLIGAMDDKYIAMTPDGRQIRGAYRQGTMLFVEKLPFGNSSLSLERQYVDSVCNVENNRILGEFRDWKKIIKIVNGRCPANVMLGKFGFEMIHLAAFEGSMERVRHLSTWKSGIKTRASISPWSPATPLDFAALGGHEHLTRYLVESGADVVRKADRDTTLLHFAIAGGNLDTVKYVLSLGFDVNERNVRSETFLHYAAREGSTEIVKYLIERGAELNAKAVNGAGVMHFAAAGGDLEIVRQLRLLGVSLNSKTRDGQTPLHYAAMFGTVPAVLYLVREGLSPWDTTADGLTPFHCSVMGRNHFVPNYLIMKFLTEPPPDSTEGSVRKSSLSIVRDRKGRGLLHYCAYLEDPAIARYLVNYGIDVNMEDNDGLKAADHARKTGNEELLRILASSPGGVSRRWR